MTTRGKIIFTLLFLAFVGFGVVRWWGKLKPASGPLSFMRAKSCKIGAIAGQVGPLP